MIGQSRDKNSPTILDMAEPEDGRVTTSGVGDDGTAELLVACRPTAYPAPCHTKRRLLEIKACERPKAYVIMLEGSLFEVFTCWNTVLFSGNRDTLGQLALTSKKSNVLLLTQDGRTARLFRRESGSAELAALYVGMDESASIASDDVAGGTLFEIVGLEGDKIGLCSKDLYLSAEPDGRISLSRPHCHDWENFTIRRLGAASDLDELREYSRRRVILVQHRGNSANKLIQYMAALTLANRITNCEIVGVSLPEWGIESADDTVGLIFDITINASSWDDPFLPNFRELSKLAMKSDSVKIVLGNYFQRLEFFLDRHFYKSELPSISVDGFQPEDDMLIINVRAGDILRGFPHYPLMPIDFYAELIASSGLKPVFMGQLNDCEYVRRMKARFPTAIFLESSGPRADFDLIRRSSNIVISVSTFSWLAAWLSDAKTIHLPIYGCFNPAHLREVDLLPVDDIRYRYYLFPLVYGLPENEMLGLHDRMSGRWKEISRNQVMAIKSGTYRTRITRESHSYGLPVRLARGSSVPFDPVWYAHRYLDAAMEISEGWFEDPLHHYLDVGRLRGYESGEPT